MTDSNYHQMQSVFSYQQYLEENIELKKIISKLETSLSNHINEKNSLIKIYEDFKLIHEKTKKELNELVQKNLSQTNEKITMEKKFELELQRQKQNFERQKDEYKEQLLKLSAFDSENFKNKIIFECEVNFKEQIAHGAAEIEKLNEELLEARRKNELFIAEYETMRNEAAKEIEMLKDGHKAEVRELLFKIQLLSEKNEQSTDKEAFRELKNDYDLLRKQNVEYLSEINALRREKENSVLEKNDIRLSLMKELDTEKMKNKILEADYDRCNHSLKNFDYELNYLKSKMDEKNEELRSCLDEKFSIAKQLKDKENDFESIKAEIKVVRQKMEERDREINETLLMSNEKEKHAFLQEKQEKETLMRQIESLSLDLKDNQIEFKNFYERANEEIHTYKRDFYIVSEEKRNLQSRVHELQRDIEFIRDEFDRKTLNNTYLEKEISSLQERYRELAVKEVENHKAVNELELILKKKNEELEEAHKNSNSLIKMLKEGNFKDPNIKELIAKKEMYKKKVKFLFSAKKQMKRYKNF